MSLKRGDVILCQVPMPSTGLTQSKLRPAIVVSKDLNNDRLDDVIAHLALPTSRDAASQRNTSSMARKSPRRAFVSPPSSAVKVS